MLSMLDIKLICFLQEVLLNFCLVFRHKNFSEILASSFFLPSETPQKVERGVEKPRILPNRASVSGTAHEDCPAFAPGAVPVLRSCERSSAG